MKRSRRVRRVQGDETRAKGEARVSAARSIGLHAWRLAMAFVAVVMVGCAQDKEPQPANQVPPPEPKPLAPLANTPQGNPNRVYQLDTLKKVDLKIKGHTVHAWIMDDEGKQEEGMMFLEDKDVKPDEGMLFAFDEIQPKTRSNGMASGFWMRNTLIPLDIVYLSPGDKVVKIAEGKVQDDTSLPAGADYKNVIELKAGTAAKYGLKPGDTVTIPKLR